MAHDPSESAVVVAVDVAGDPSAPLRLGAELARLLAVPVVLAAVLSDGPALGVAEDERRTPTQWRDDLLALGRTVEGVAVADAWAIAAGSPERGLQEVTERPGVTAVVIGSSDRAGGGRVLAGSVGQRLVSGAACPVAVTPRGYDENAIAAPEVIGVAFDGSPESVPALEAASALAERARALLRVITVHVSRPIGGPHDLGRQATARPDELKLRAVHDAAVVAHSGGTRVEGVFAVGDPARVLTDQSHDLGLLVTGSRGYGPLGAVLAGGTTHELLRTAACPLLILPRGRGLEIVDRHRV